MEYIKINNFMLHGETKIERNKIVDINYDLKQIFNEGSKNEIYNDSENIMSTEMIEYQEDKTCRYCQKKKQMIIY